MTDKPSSRGDAAAGSADPGAAVDATVEDAALAADFTSAADATDADPVSETNDTAEAAAVDPDSDDAAPSPAGGTAADSADDAGGGRSAAGTDGRNDSPEDTATFVAAVTAALTRAESEGANNGTTSEPPTAPAGGSEASTPPAGGAAASTDSSAASAGGSGAAAAPVDSTAGSAAPVDGADASAAPADGAVASAVPVDRAEAPIAPARRQGAADRRPRTATAATGAGAGAAAAGAGSAAAGAGSPLSAAAAPAAAGTSTPAAATTTVSATAVRGADAQGADAQSGAGTGGGATGGDDTSGDDTSGDDTGSSRRGKAVVIALAAVVVVLGIAYGVAYAVAGDSLARGATVAGIEVGGMTPEEAEAALTEQLPEVVDQPIHLVLGDGETTYEIVPSAAGLTVDVPATVGDIPGGSANPVSLFQALLGAGETDPVPSVDQAALEASLTEIAEQANTEPVNGAVAFDGGEVVTSEPQIGRAVDVEATSEQLRAAFFGEQATLPVGDVPLVVAEVQPAVSAEEVQRAVAEFAEPAMSAPVTVVAGEQSVELPPELIGQALTLTPDDAGTLQPALDGAALTDIARDELAEVGQEGRDATITIENGAPVVVPAEMGQGIAPDALSAAVLPALTEQGDARQAPVELTEVDPELTTAAAEELGVTEVVAEFTTRFPHAEYRNVNIGTAAERIDNTLILPGEEFSLNGIVGERTEANGFTSGTIINGGRLEESLGGGVSQVATTTFHAAFLAGLDDVEHWPHSIYFDRYPLGQEATVAWGAKDMRFGNDTPYGVVVDTSFTASTPGNQGSLTVRIWSTQHYRVETSVSERSNFTSPQTIYDTSSNCQAQGGSQGFDVTSYRQVWGPDGTLVKDEADPWTYNPNHRVICGPEPGQGGD